MLTVCRFAAASIFTLMLSACADDTSSSDASPEHPVATSETTHLGQVNPGAFGLGETGIEIDLDTPPHPATSATTACLFALPPDFVIGQATCVTNTALVTPVTAAHARQYCSSIPDFREPVGPTATLAIEGCETLDIAVYSFDPNLKITLIAP